MSVVLLVGVTGCGKSTIFNFLSGADFLFTHNKQLEIKNPQNHFSKMVGGMNSITKELNFYHNQKNNHLIIDFPGFQDTNGEWDQLLFELLFNKVVTSGNIKVIYLIKNTESSLPNRGSDLQEFIQKLFLKRNIDIQKFNLFLNCYMEDLSDDELKNQVKEDLKSVNILKSIDQILVLRKARKDNELQQIFNNQSRQIMWQQIEKMQSIKIQLQKLPNSEKISDYLRSTTQKTIQEYANVLREAFDKQLLTLSDQQTQATLKKLEKLFDFFKGVNQKSALDWYINYISICEQLANTLSLKDNIVKQSNNFKEIFTYFSQFSDLIKGYDDMNQLKFIAEDQLNYINKIISERLQILETKAKLTEQEQEKKILQQIIKNQQDQIRELEQKINNMQRENKINLELYKQNMQSQIDTLKMQSKQDEQKLKKAIQNQEETIQQLNKKVNSLTKPLYEPDIPFQRTHRNNTSLCSLI